MPCRFSAEDRIVGYVLHRNARGLPVTLLSLNELFLDLQEVEAPPQQLPPWLLAVHHVALGVDASGSPSMTRGGNATLGRGRKRRKRSRQALGSALGALANGLSADTPPLRSFGALRCCSLAIGCSRPAQQHRVQGVSHWDERVLALESTAGWTSCSWTVRRDGRAGGQAPRVKDDVRAPREFTPRAVYPGLAC